MKRFTVMTIVIAVVFSFTGLAQAIDLQVGDIVRIFDSTGSTAGGEFKVFEYPNSPTGNDPNDYLVTFCLETIEYISFNTRYEVTNISDYAIKGGRLNVGDTYPPGDKLERATKWLYAHFIIEKLPGYDTTSLAAHIASANGLQRAIWYLEGEIPYSQTDAYARYLIGLDKSTPIGGTVKALNLNGIDDNPDLGVNVKQSMLHYEVPEPGTLMLVGGYLLIGIGLSRSRRRDDA